jgi:hypothetical protein
MAASERDFYRMLGVPRNASQEASLLARSRRAGRGLRLAGLAALGAGGILGAHLSFRLAAGVNHNEAVPHLVEPGWHHLAVTEDLPEGKPVRVLLGEIPLVAVKAGGEVNVIAHRCSHMSGPLQAATSPRVALPAHGMAVSSAFPTGQ